MRYGTLIALASLAIGCGGEALVQLDFPPLGAARSALLVVTEGADVEVIAADIEGGVIRATRPTAPIDARIELLLYDDDLATLTIPAGGVRRASSPNGFPLPPTRAVFAASITAGVGGGWSMQTAPSAEATAFRSTIEGPARCKTLRVHAGMLPLTPDFVFRLDALADTVLIGSGRVMFTLRDEDLQPVLVTGMPDFVPRAGNRRSGGDAFLAGDDGRIAYVRVTVTGIDLVPVDVPAAQPGVRFVDGGFDENGEEYFTLSRDGTISRVRSRAPAEKVTAFDPLAPERLQEYGGIARMGFGVGVAGTISSPRVVSSDMPARALSLQSGITAVDVIPAFGTLIGTADGEIYELEANALRPLFATKIALGLTAMAPFGVDGLIYASTNGQVGYYRPEVGACVDEAVLLRTQGRFIIPRPAYGDWLITGDRLESAGARYAIVTVE